MENVPKIYAAMHNIMESIPSIPKGQTAPQGYKFRGIADALGVAHPKFLANDVICVPHVRNTTREQHTINNKFALITVVEVEYIFYSTIDGSSVTSAVSGEGLSWSQDKATAIAMSNAFKMMMWQTFCIPVADKELDGENTQEPQGNSKTSDKRPPAQAPNRPNNKPQAQNKPLVADLDTISKTLAQLNRPCKVWVYEEANVEVDSPVGKLSELEAKTMLQLLKDNYAEQMPQSSAQEDHSDEPDYDTGTPLSAVCNICGADMVDKRQYGGKVAFKCSKSNWNKETKTEDGCDGTVWQNEVDKHPDQYPEIQRS